MSTVASQVAQFEQVVADMEGVVRVVVTQIDPDAIGAAVAMAHLLHSHYERHVVIGTAGQFSHPQNRLLSNKYDLGNMFQPLREGEHISNVVLLDSSVIEDARLPRGLVLAPRIIIDHHRGSSIISDPNQAPVFQWVDDVGVGSTCTLVCELLQAINQEPHHPLLLALGIYTDTRGLLSAGQRDRVAFNWLSDFFSPQELAELTRYQLPATYYDHWRYALGHLAHHHSVAITGIGTVSANDADNVSTIADELSRREGVSLVIVWAIINSQNGVVRLSARSNNASVGLHQMLRDWFGPRSGAKVAPDGHGEGGATIELNPGFWLSNATREGFEHVVHQRLIEVVSRH